MVVKALMAKYMPKDRISRVELRQMLASVSMKDNEDPATLFEQISAIENKFNTVSSKIEEEELIAVVMSAAPKAYVSVITTEQRLQGTNLQLADLESAMTQPAVSSNCWCDWWSGSWRQRVYFECLWRNLLQVP